MLNFLESLPFPITTLIVAGLSVAATGLLYVVGLRKLLWAAAFIVSFAISYCVYWSAVWFRPDPPVAEYSAWANLFIGLWFVFSTLASTAFAWVLLKGRRAREHV